MNEFGDHSGAPKQLVEHFFRHESAGLVAMLVGKFGFALIDVVEDMVQEAMCEALASWRIRGVPDNPSAWLHRVARNRIVDALRRNRRSEPIVDSLVNELQGSENSDINPDEIQDGLLRMMFACCHPALDRTSQLALSLKVLCGMGDPEIARGLLISAQTAKKRVTRAKRTLQLRRLELDLPPPALLCERLDGVHEVLYLMFNEGYSATRGDAPVKIDLCEEAARLCQLLCESEIGSPSTCALMALTLFHAARFKARVTIHGESVLLDDQDRRLWDRDMIKVADYWLARSTAGAVISRFHLEAGIARLHCQAHSIEDTDWDSILRHYDVLMTQYPSPMVELNRAVVLGRVGRAEEGLQRLTQIVDQASIENYPFLHCAIADLADRSGHKLQAIRHLEIALRLVASEHERTLLQHRLRGLQKKVSS